jgi:hypothetical protein
LRISLLNAIGGGYPLNDYDSYTVAITTGAMDQAEKDTADASFEIAPVIFNDLKSMLLNSNVITPVQLLIDARDENGDSLVITIAVSNSSAVQATLNGNVISIAPVAGAAGTAGAIKVQATANGKPVEKTFVVMVTDQDVGFGKSFEVKGLFENQEDANTHKVILDGGCTITGYNGYSNQGFYSSVKDLSGAETVAPGNVTIQHTFNPAGAYLLGASLKMQSGTTIYSYDYEQGVNDRYVLTVSCPDANDSDSTIASLLNIDLSGTVFGAVILADIDGDGDADLADAVTALKIMTQLVPSAVRSDYASSGVDVNGDGKVGLQEVDYILQKLSTLR